MCITLFSTAHPQFAFILGSNRDEFIARPTAPADWWDSPNAHVLGGRDLQRPIQGTWLGITKQGRIASLTNFREATGQPVSGLKSRGGIAKSFLTISAGSRETTIESIRRIVEQHGVNDVGGFSLLLGKLSKPSAHGDREGLAIISNRTPDLAGVTWIAQHKNEVHGLSNSRFGDASWPKVTNGERLLAEAVHKHAHKSGATPDELIDALFKLLSVDTLPKKSEGEDWVSYTQQLRNSIFIPKIDGGIEKLASDQVHAAQSKEKVKKATSQPTTESWVYGTQVQTVILVGHDGWVTFVEKSLHKQGDDSTKTFRFQIEGW